MDLARLYQDMLYQDMRLLVPPHPEDQLAIHRPVTERLYAPLREQLYEQLGRQLRGADGEGLI